MRSFLYINQIKICNLVEMMTTKCLPTFFSLSSFWNSTWCFFVGGISISKNSFSLYKHIISEPDSFPSLFGSMLVFTPMHWLLQVLPLLGEVRVRYCLNLTLKSSNKESYIFVKQLTFFSPFPPSNQPTNRPSLHPSIHVQYKYLLPGDLEMKIHNPCL